MCNYANSLIKSEKKAEKKSQNAEKILIDEKNYKDLVTRFTNHVDSIPIKMLRLHYDKFNGKIEEHEGKNIVYDEKSYAT